MTIDNEALEKFTKESPWRNVYWFARMLINNDQYGGFGKETDLLANIGSRLRYIIEDPSVQDDKTKINLCKTTIRNILTQRFQRAYTKIDRINQFCDDINDKLLSIEDIRVFILTIELVMIPLERAISQVPNDDREFAEASARAYLDELGELGLSTVINIWDDLGVHGCLNAERVIVVREFSNLRRILEDFSEENSNLILTAFMQEFERRLGQKRKFRAGNSLEDVASFIFGYYHIQATSAPEHFQADIEVDKWIRCSDRWLIGISCKRTLRERWKQVTSADRINLSNHRIKQIWHLLTYDEDLSDAKITTLGGMGHVFYLSDDSRILVNASNNIGMKDYVRPMSKFVEDIRSVQGL